MPGSRNLISSAAGAPKARIKFSLPGMPGSENSIASLEAKQKKKVLTQEYTILASVVVQGDRIEYY